MRTMRYDKVYVQIFVFQKLHNHRSFNFWDINLKYEYEYHFIVDIIYSSLIKYSSFTLFSITQHLVPPRAVEQFRSN